ncbi:MAG: hypothetical protein AVDCRST_MAG79-1336, partial [uncultured Thermoleophilia bacterium]
EGAKAATPAPRPPIPGRAAARGAAATTAHASAATRAARRPDLLGGRALDRRHVGRAARRRRPARARDLRPGHHRPIDGRRAACAGRPARGHVRAGADGAGRPAARTRARGDGGRAADRARAARGGGGPGVPGRPVAPVARPRQPHLGSAGPRRPPPRGRRAVRDLGSDPPSIPEPRLAAVGVGPADPYPPGRGRRLPRGRPGCPAARDRRPVATGRRRVREPIRRPRSRLPPERPRHRHLLPAPGRRPAAAAERRPDRPTAGPAARPPVAAGRREVRLRRAAHQPDRRGSTESRPGDPLPRQPHPCPPPAARRL